MENIKKSIQKGLFAFMFLLMITNQVYSNDIFQKEKISIKMNNVELREVLNEIKSQTAYDFLYNANDLDDKVLVSIDVKNADIQTILRLCFESKPITYIIQDNIIVLKKFDQVTEESKTLKGIVVDANNNPLGGVAVIVDGTIYGTATNENGEFSMTIPAKNVYILKFSFIGKEPLIIEVTPGKTVRVVLKDKSEEMEEVVVTGMEVVKKVRMTGSTSVILAKDIKMQGITSIDRILDGRISGLNSTTISGAPGTRSKITIRGENNLSGSTEPLWIVDGLPMLSGVPKSTTGDYAGTIMQDGVGNIMPDDIESITILKDASAAAIYGARAANGVIVITTKKGFRSKMQFSYSGTYEFGIAPQSNIDFMNTEEKLSYEKSIIDNYGINYSETTGRGGFLYRRKIEGYLTQNQYEEQLNALKRNNTNWFDVIFRTSHSHSHSVSLRGGNDEITYYTSLNYQEKNGILINNKYQNAGVLVKLDYRPINNLIVAMNFSANTRKNQNNASVMDPFKYAVFANPYERPYDENGRYAYDLSYLSGNYTAQTASGYVYDKLNILREIKNNRLTQNGLDADFTLNLRYEVVPGLSIEAIARKGVSYNTEMTEIDEGTYTSYANESFARQVYPNQSVFPSQYDNGELAESSGHNNNWSTREQIDYSFHIKENHLFSILLANEITSKKINNFGYKSPLYSSLYRITGIPEFDNSVSYNKLSTSIRDMFNTYDGQDRSVSFLGSLRYSFKDKYVFNFNYRADGADAIGDSNRFTPLWSVGVKYNIDKEKFFNVDFIDQLSVRGSFGYTGNIDRSAYPFSTIVYGDNTYEGNRLVNTFSYPNPSVGWEKKMDRNIGLDITLLKHRVSLTADYYSNKTSDVLEKLNVPNSTGRTEVKANGGIVTNSGWEVNLNIRWYDNTDWSFSTSFNIAGNKNVIKKSYYGYKSYKDAIKTNVSQGGVINIEGEETGGIYGWKYAGVDKTNGNPMYYLTDEGKSYYAKLLDSWGSLSAYRQNEYSQFITDITNVPDVVGVQRNYGMKMDYYMPSMQYLGRSNPKYIGGFNTLLRYKTIEFATSWTFKTGHIIPLFNDYQNAPNNTVNSQYGYTSDLGVSNTNRERRYLGYWQTYGDITDVPAFVTSGNDYWASVQTSDKYGSGNYLRMTNLSINYRIPSSLLNNTKLTNLTIGFNARNLLTFTKYQGLDVGTMGAFSYPVSKEFNFKLTVGF